MNRAPTCAAEIAIIAIIIAIPGPLPGSDPA